MELYFLRHGIAEDEGPEGTGDAGRRLTDKGIAQMKDEARGLRRFKVLPEALFTSPLVRAQQTAEIVAQELGVQIRTTDVLAPGSDVDRLLELLAEFRTAEQVLLVGHEPDLGKLIGALTGGYRVWVKKGGVARVDLAVLEPGAGSLLWLLPPRVLRVAGR